MATKRRNESPRPPAPPVLTPDEASAAASAVHTDARQHERWAREAPNQARLAQHAAILRSALLKLLCISHPDGPDVAAAVAKAWDELSDKDEERERREKVRR